MIPNDKLNISGRDIWAIVLTAAATALCAAIDLLLQEEKKDT